MISLVDDKTVSTVQGFKGDTVGIRILSNMSAYGLDRSFALFWRQINDSGTVTALVGKMDSSLFLTASEIADYEELSLFVNTMKEQGGAVFCPLSNAKRLSFYSVYAYYEMVFKGLPNQQTTGSKSEATFKQIYEILKAGQDGDITLPPFDGWYADFSHKTRHGQARSLVLEQSAVAVTSAELHDCALISGVSVLPQKRGTGLGREVVLMLCKELINENKTVYVVCSDDLTEFYKKLGFTHLGETAICI